jgi:hypothetical protein
MRLDTERDHQCLVHRTERQTASGTRPPPQHTLNRWLVGSEELGDSTLEAGQECRRNVVVGTEDQPRAVARREPFRGFVPRDDRTVEFRRYVSSGSA